MRTYVAHRLPLIIAILSACYRALDRNGHPVLHEHRLGQAPQDKWQHSTAISAIVGSQLLSLRPGAAGGGLLPARSQLRTPG
ncbi:hypothetical protein MES5069_180063 [Mesorhizobium escarrei]|uniref:Uncharacterized protein n=1 Tax=Mesorhizobium escarrei TaxID=666018 RepID=A0ABM9DNZ8_9HYPH|nr:hypothetical protein MES5069_180063 [Mesorhizobium escarrei]